MVIPARADFRFYENKQDLSSFSWGEPPHVNSVYVGPDSPEGDR
jgi:hypothetical protein